MSPTAGEGEANGPSLPPPGRGLLDGIPRGFLRAALRRAADPAPETVAAAPAASVPGPLTVREEEFRDPFPPDLFGSGFRWTGKGGEDLAFFDIETCGLADDPIFLVGILQPSAGALRFSRALARDPSGEPALLRWAAGLLGARPSWVSFNGRSFDAPRIRRRASLHGVDVPDPTEHIDLLLAVRRRWKDRLPDCRLGTVERRLLGLERGTDDVPGREVPARYWDFVRTGEARWILPVLEHNRRDVAAMAVLYHRLSQVDPG